MSGVSGGFFQRRLSSSTESETALAWQEALLLLGLGVAAVALHAIFRWPMHLPGRHGLEWMALLVIGRCGSRFRWAASVSSVGAAGSSLLPVWGADDPFGWLIYLLPGLVIDAGVQIRRHWRTSLWFLALLGGAAHATKPLARLLISTLSGWPYGSLLNGVLYPLATHIAFGAIGGLLGATLGLAAWHRRRL